MDNEGIDVEKSKKVKQEELAKWRMECDWHDVKYSNQRQNTVADYLITTEIQAAAIFVALAGALLNKAGIGEQVLKFNIISLVVAIALFSISILIGIFGFYKKELFWKEEAKKYTLTGREWREVWQGDITFAHAKETVVAVREGAMSSQSTIYPMVCQTAVFVLGLIASFVGLIQAL